jgi:hypothetical protein
MQNTERQKFEEDWKSAFDGAEMSPPDRVWSSIELDLAGQESATMKRRVVFYQRLAAATVLFALLSGGYGFYGSRESGVSSKEAVVSSQESREADVVDGKSDARVGQSHVARAQKPGDVVKPTPQLSGESISETEQNTTQLSIQDAPILAISPSGPATGQPGHLLGTETPGDPSTAQPGNPSASASTEVAIASPLLQDESSPREIVEPKRKSRSESTLWLAVGAAAGNYSPNTPSATVNATAAFAGPTIASSAAPQRKPEPKIGSSYTIGMAVGKKFGRIVLQTGINLARQQIQYASNYDVPTSSNSAKAASYDYITTQGSSQNLNFTNTYSVNSTNEILSIPVQVGYMIVDRKIGWQFNTGVSSDFFLRNILVDESGQREKFTQSSGSACPYRAVNWSGLLNTELSYRLGAHYRLSLVPGVRYSIHSILKEPTDNGRPVIFDVGFKFRYLFE